MSNTTSSITLTAFETIEGLFGQITRMGAFETCADPRGYIRTSTRLFDVCVDAIGYAAADAFASSVECAANLLTDCYIGKIEVLDMEGV